MFCKNATKTLFALMAQIRQISASLQKMIIFTDISDISRKTLVKIRLIRFAVAFLFVKK